MLKRTLAIAFSGALVAATLIAAPERAYAEMAAPAKESTKSKKEPAKKETKSDRQVRHVRRRAAHEVQ